MSVDTGRALRMAYLVAGVAGTVVWGFLPRPIPIEPKAAALLTSGVQGLLVALSRVLACLDEWSEPTLERSVREFAEAEGRKLGEIAARKVEEEIAWTDHAAVLEERIRKVTVAEAPTARQERRSPRTSNTSASSAIPTR